MTDDLAAFRHARGRVLARIAEACLRAGRAPADVTLVAVSKTVPAERVRVAVEAGFTVLGENRVQELVAKAPDVPGAAWHLIGPLQSNKARKAVEAADVIESIDSVDLAQRLDRIVREVHGEAARYPVFLQVNVDEDPAKAGFQADALPDALGQIGALGALDVRGLMTVGRLVPSVEAARPTFAGLRELSVRLRQAFPWLGPGLSMGMSEDYPVAIEEGATVVRVGRAIFGERPPG
jgi:pyridoxal phosphate enzyme (YggS family)